MQYQDTLDWIYIAYRTATYLPPEQRPRPLTSEQQRLFATPKPWDFLEEIADPHAFMSRFLLSFPDQIEANSKDGNHHEEYEGGRTKKPECKMQNG